MGVLRKLSQQVAGHADPEPPQEQDPDLHLLEFFDVTHEASSQSGFVRQEKLREIMRYHVEVMARLVKLALNNNIYQCTDSSTMK